MSSYLMHLTDSVQQIEAIKHPPCFHVTLGGKLFMERTIIFVQPRKCIPHGKIFHIEKHNNS